jgi:DNA-binding NarL/FixJ family response regulator
VTSPLRILVADDHEIVRLGICSLLQNHAGWKVCGQAEDGRQALTLVEQLQPDIVVIDLGMPNLNGLEATRRIIRRHPGQKVLIVSV